MQALACHLLNHEHRNIHNWFPPAKLVRQSTKADKCICIYRKNNSQQIAAICLCLRLHLVLATSFKYLLWPARRKVDVHCSWNPEKEPCKCQKMILAMYNSVGCVDLSAGPTALHSKELAVLQLYPMRLKAREMTQHGGPPG